MFEYWSSPTKKELTLAKLSHVSKQSFDRAQKATNIDLVQASHNYETAKELVGSSRVLSPRCTLFDSSPFIRDGYRFMISGLVDRRSRAADKALDMDTPVKGRGAIQCSHLLPKHLRL